MLRSNSGSVHTIRNSGSPICWCSLPWRYSLYRPTGHFAMAALVRCPASARQHQIFFLKYPKHDPALRPARGQDLRPSGPSTLIHELWRAGAGFRSAPSAPLCVAGLKPVNWKSVSLKSTHQRNARSCAASCGVDLAHASWRRRSRRGIGGGHTAAYPPARVCSQKRRWYAKVLRLRCAGAWLARNACQRVVLFPVAKAGLSVDDQPNFMDLPRCALQFPSRA